MSFCPREWLAPVVVGVDKDADGGGESRWPRQPQVRSGRLAVRRGYRQPSSASMSVKLRAGMRPLAAREDPHRFQPGRDLVSPASAQDAGQLGHAGLLGLASAVPAVPVRTSALSAALADLPGNVHGDLPCPRGDHGDGWLLPCAQFPAD